MPPRPRPPPSLALARPAVAAPPLRPRGYAATASRRTTRRPRPSVRFPATEPCHRAHARPFSAAAEKENADQKDAEPKDAEKSSEGSADEDLRETIDRLSGRSPSPPPSDVPGRILDALHAFRSEVAATWTEMVSPKDRTVNKTVGGAPPPQSSSPPSPSYDGPAELVAVSPDADAWEKMQQRLAEAPIIRDILGASHRVFESSGAAKAKERLEDIRGDAREAWETSQSPWVYRMSSVYDTLTAESEEAVATRELRRLDPEFSLEEFKEDVVEGVLPVVMGHLLQGNTKELKPWLSEAVYRRVGTEIRLRKQEGLVIDPHILGIDNSEILACKIDEVDKGSPIIVMFFQCQQINCVRNKDNEIVEGGEDEIRANIYVVAFQREYDDETHALNWRIVDFMLNGSQPWL